MRFEARSNFVMGVNVSPGWDRNVHGGGACPLWRVWSAIPQVGEQLPVLLEAGLEPRPVGLAQPRDGLVHDPNADDVTMIPSCGSCVIGDARVPGIAPPANVAAVR